MNTTITFQSAMIITALGATGAYIGFKTGTLPKKVAVGLGLGVGALALVSAEFESLETSLPWVVGGGLVIAAAILLI
jgi:4-hydroxybenzoate polyprenyltransferase